MGEFGAQYLGISFASQPMYVIPQEKPTSRNTLAFFTLPAASVPLVAAAEIKNRTAPMMIARTKMGWE